MGMSHATERWTAEHVRALPDDGKRYELIEGELVVTPAPCGLHQEAVMALIRRLDPWLRERGIARMLASPADLALGEDEVLQPDLFVCRTANGTAVRDWSDIAALLLIIEVLSPTTARYDRQLKRRRYQRAGVPEYWIVDPDARLIERWHPPDSAGPEVITDQMRWEPVPGHGVLEFGVGALFAELNGEA
ncbi:MAG TPA: Uma2 family endonuclease [Gemmatimonadaceae bacterium]